MSIPLSHLLGGLKREGQVQVELTIPMSKVYRLELQDLPGSLCSVVLRGFWRQGRVGRKVGIYRRTPLSVT